MFKFSLGQLVYYYINDKLHSAPVLSRRYVDNCHPTWVDTKEQVELFTRFGPNSSIYATVHGEFPEDMLFISTYALAEDFARRVTA